MTEGTAAGPPAIPQLDEEQLGVLLALLDTPAPSGFEGPAAARAAEWSETWAGDVRLDSVGNCIATVNPGAGTRLMVTGHLDEIGFIITRIDERGLLLFEAVGGWDATVVVGQRVRVLARDGILLGTVGRLPAHQLAEGATAPRLKDLWIDVGMRSADEARARVRPGDAVVLDTEPRLLPNRRVMSRSADNRLGLFVAFEAARRCAGAHVEVVAVGTISEETSGAGALTSTYGVQPDAAIAVDVTYTSDVPGEHEEDIVLGGGPVIIFGAAARSRIGRELLEIAGGRGMPVQLSASGSATHTDADEVSRTAAGIPTGLLCVPTRYLHSPGELFDLADVEACIVLLEAWLRRHG